jgi:hypothetical protein
MNEQTKLVCDLRHMLSARRMYYGPTTRRFLDVVAGGVYYLWYEYGMTGADMWEYSTSLPVFYTDRTVSVCEFRCPRSVAQRVDRDLRLRGISSVTCGGTA